MSRDVVISQLRLDKRGRRYRKTISIIEKIKGHGRKDNPRLDEIEKELRKLNANKKPSRRIH